MPKTTKGKLYEEYVYERLIIPEEWMNLTPYVLKKHPSKSGQRYTHKEFPSQFKERFHFDPAKVWTRKIKPDFVFYNPVLKKVVALEVKSQHEDGSVDEKLQTGGKKLKRLRKLFGLVLQIPAENISYSYLLQESFFNKTEYGDIFDDIHEDGCEYYFINDDFSFEIK